MKTELLREDIVNHTIRNLWVTAWTDINTPDAFPFTKEPYYYQQVYIELDNGDTFGIQGQDPFKEFPIVSVDMKTIDVNATDDSFLIDCIGQKIIEVLTSNLIPTVCVLLSNKKLLFCSACGFAFDSFGPLSQDLGHEYDIEDFATYWGHKPLHLDSYDFQ
jgi:hypothetical protein